MSEAQARQNRNHDVDLGQQHYGGNFRRALIPSQQRDPSCEGLVYYRNERWAGVWRGSTAGLLQTNSLDSALLVSDRQFVSLRQRRIVGLR